MQKPPPYPTLLVQYKISIQDQKKKKTSSPPPTFDLKYILSQMLSHSSHILVARERQCTKVSEECAVTSSFYGYAPSYPPNAILLALFGLAFIIHMAQGLYFRTWGILVAFSLGCLCEVIGKIRSSNICIGIICEPPSPFPPPTHTHTSPQVMMG